MKLIVIDTCTVIHIIRGTSTGTMCLDAINNYDTNPRVVISAVTKAELESFMIQNNWGLPKKLALRSFLQNVTYIDIINSDIALISSYSSIDAFSKRKAEDKNGSFLNGSVRKMGKNDLWIAATSHVLEAPLLTTDGDFDHLDKTFIDVIKIQ